MHTQSFIPASPWLNPVIDEGIHDATIVAISEGSYGTEEKSFVRLVLWLGEPNVCLVTNFYQPRTSKSQYRLHYLCRCVDCDLEDVFETPYVFCRRELRVEVGTATPHGGVSRLYSEVKSFIPPEGHAEANEDLIQEAKNKYEDVLKLV